MDGPLKDTEQTTPQIVTAAVNIISSGLARLQNPGEVIDDWSGRRDLTTFQQGVFDQLANSVVAQAQDKDYLRTIFSPYGIAKDSLDLDFVFAPDGSSGHMAPDALGLDLMRRCISSTAVSRPGEPFDVALFTSSLQDEVLPRFHDRYTKAQTASVFASAATVNTSPRSIETIPVGNPEEISRSELEAIADGIANKFGNQADLSFPGQLFYADCFINILQQLSVEGVLPTDAGPSVTI